VVPVQRLANAVAKKKARAALARTGDFF
jgi:hypothetical protein